MTFKTPVSQASGEIITAENLTSSVFLAECKIFLHSARISQHLYLTVDNTRAPATPNAVTLLTCKDWQSYH